YQCDISFNYLTRVYKTKIEKEANSFACKLLMNDINIKEQENTDFIAMEKGIPLKVWHSVMELI
ncbi:MAG: ImmA/IrrE family metallo-endopeptidase, partial [Thomasclavelia ramosa]